MKALELLAPARNLQIGIAAIDCGADAVYIGAEQFGARKDAHNSLSDIRQLCDYAHKFGVRIFLTVNTTVGDDELGQVHTLMLDAQDAGIDAFIIRDSRICAWDDITVPLHASTQCAIRDAQRAKLFESLGCSRLVLERELSLETIKEIRQAVNCELEFFVHGAICVCYSGDCGLSEYIDGRSADRGECIQACRSLYDLYDGDGKLLLKNKAILSLKDYKLKERLGDLADSGICSFKIEGRLKNESYVRNVVREYDLALNELISRHPDEYCRSSFGRVGKGFIPDSDKTFNRGYTSLFLDGKRGNWSSMDSPKSMGEEIGRVAAIKPVDKYNLKLTIQSPDRNLNLRNGDGFAILSDNAIVGFRGDVCQGNTIICKRVKELRPGSRIWRNVSTDFEKEIENNSPKREIPVNVVVRISGEYNIELIATTADGRCLSSPFGGDMDRAENRDRAESMLREQLSKRSGIYNFTVTDIITQTKGDSLPLLSASTINSMRRLLAEDLDRIPVKMMEMARGERTATDLKVPQSVREGELMRTKYCVRYELGMCPKNHGVKGSEPLYIVNNGQRFAIPFDCRACEMTLKRGTK